MALFLFLLVKTVLASLLTERFVALKPPFPFGRPSLFKFFRLCPRHSAQALRWYRQHHQVCYLPLLFSDSRSILATLFSVFRFSSNSLAGTVFSLMLCYQTTMGPEHSFLLGNNAADELSRRKAHLLSFAVPCIFSPLTSCIHLFLGLEAYCLIYIFRSTDYLGLH